MNTLSRRVRWLFVYTLFNVLVDDCKKHLLKFPTSARQTRQQMV